MRYLCWDIDGTLLLTNNAGLDALNLTIRERLGQDYHFTHPLGGTTDSAIVKEVVTALKGRCSSADAAGLPPAKEIMPGLAIILKISRMALPLIWSKRCAKRRESSAIIQSLLTFRE